MAINKTIIKAFTDKAGAAIGTTDLTVTSSLKLPDGTVGSPGLQFKDDTDNGLYRSATDKWHLVTGGSAALTVDNLQRVGIGSSNPSNLLFVEDDTAAQFAASIDNDNATGHGLRVQVAGTSGSQTVFEARANNGSSTLFHVEANGEVGINEINPGNFLGIDVNDSGTSQSSFKGITIGNSDTTTNNGAAINFNQGGGGSGNSFARIGAIHEDRTGSSEDTHLFFGTIGSGTYGERMRITSDGNVGIGTSGPDSNTSLHVVKGAGTLPSLAVDAIVVFQNNDTVNGDAVAHIISGTSGFGGVTFGDSGDKDIGAILYDHGTDLGIGANSMLFKTNATNAMIIDSSQNVNIPGLSASSDVQTDGSKNLITTSDMRLKDNLGYLKSGLEIINNLKPVYYSWKHCEGSHRELGFMAQETREVLPEAAPYNPDTDTWGFNTRAVVAALTAAVQELSARLEALENA